MVSACCHSLGIFHRISIEPRASRAASGQVIEIRLPYMAIGFADPSSLQALRITPRGRVDTETVERVGISVVLDGVLYQTNGYAWEGWNSVRWHERPKAGLEHFAEAVRESSISELLTR